MARKNKKEPTQDDATKTARLALEVFKTRAAENEEAKRKKPPLHLTCADCRLVGRTREAVMHEPCVQCAKPVDLCVTCALALFKVKRREKPSNPLPWTWCPTCLDEVREK